MSKQNKLLVTIFALISFEVSALECKLFNTRYIDNKKTISKQENLCVVDYENSSRASSKNCLMAQVNTCPFHKVKKTLEYESFIQEVGSPGFNLCHYLKGSPQLYEVEIQGKWKPFERCFWKDLKEFSDIDGLITFYKSL